ncbi:hypothetical protein [Phenylobacterium sp.]|uniref:hypothetical protein n=1 Tax=Phenylobacterium sp. TaxID=1871053 RepID=UPI0026093713|nr:hypothetical protein [Phenylobacterium sp.]
MSQPVLRRTEHVDWADAELAMWPGVSWSREARSKHHALILTYRGQSRKVIYPCSSSDSFRGPQNHLRDIRNVLKALGAERQIIVKQHGVRRKRNRTSPHRVVIADRATGGPKRDPWEALKEMRFPEPVTEQPRRKTLWQRVKGWIT